MQAVCQTVMTDHLINQIMIASKRCVVSAVLSNLPLVSDRLLVIRAKSTHQVLLPLLDDKVVERGGVYMINDIAIDIDACLRMIHCCLRIF